jgi:Predicted ATPase of the ABC class
VRQQSGGWGGEKGGEMTVDLPGQHVLERTSVLLAATGDLEARFTVALPAKGRTVLGAWAAAILITNLPRCFPDCSC